MTLALGSIADDYTGASDLANTLTRCGLRTIQTVGVPAADIALPEVDAVVVALTSRSIAAVALSLADSWRPDLSPSTKTRLLFEGAGDPEADTVGGRNMHFGIRARGFGS